MRIFPILLISMISINISAQNLDECGIDSNPKLNLTESKFLNEYLSDRRNEFDFTNKKIIFVTGNSGNFIKDKSDYFKNVRERIGTNSRIGSDIIVLTEDEKIKSGGYDAIVTYWIKVLTERRKRKILSEINTGR